METQQPAQDGTVAEYKDACKEVAQQLTSLSKAQKYSNLAGVVAVGSFAGSELLMGNKSETAYKIKKIGGITSMSAGLVDAFSGSASRLSAARKVYNQRKVNNCLEGENNVQAENPEVCQRLENLEKKIKTASNDAYLMGAGKAIGGALAMELANRHSGSRNETNSVSPARVVSYGSYVPKKVNSVGFTTAATEAVSGDLSKKTSESSGGAESTGALGSYGRSGFAPSDGLTDSGSTGFGGTGSSGGSSHGDASGPLTEYGEDLALADPDDIWATGGGGGLGFGGNLSSGDSEISKLIKSLKPDSDKNSKNKDSYGRYPASGSSGSFAGQKKSGNFKNENLFLRIKKVLHRSYFKGKISAEELDINKL